MDTTGKRTGDRLYRRGHGDGHIKQLNETKMNITKEQSEILLAALTSAVRYAHLEGSEYDAKKYWLMHTTLVTKRYRSHEMQYQTFMPLSIREGTDLGLASTIKKIKE